MQKANRARITMEVDSVGKQCVVEVCSRTVSKSIFRFGNLILKLDNLVNKTKIKNHDRNASHGCNIATKPLLRPVIFFVLNKKSSRLDNNNSTQSEIRYDRRPPAELKVPSKLSVQNPVGTLYEIIFVLNANFYENINAHY